VIKGFFTVSEVRAEFSTLKTDAADFSETLVLMCLGTVTDCHVDLI